MKQLNRFYFDQAISIDNALTTNQIIHQLINQLNGVIEFVNNIETDAHEYTDAEISKLKIELKDEISELNDLLDLRVSELTNLIDTKKAEAVSDANGYTDVSIENLKTDYITPIIDRIDGTLERLDLKIDYVDASIRNLVDETKAELIELIKKGNSIIYSGYSGLLTSLQDEITKNVYNVWAKRFGLTWEMFDKLLSQYTLLTSLPTGDTFFKYYVISNYAIFYVPTSHVNTPNECNLIFNGDNTYDIAITFPYTTTGYANVDHITIDGVTYSNVSFTDSRHLRIRNIPIDDLNYSITYVNVFNNDDTPFADLPQFTVNYLYSEGNKKISITWDTIEFLLNKGYCTVLDFTYDFLLYFYSDFVRVFKKVIYSGDAALLLATLKNAVIISGTPQNHNELNQWGWFATGVAILQGTFEHDMLAHTPKISNLI